MTERDAASRPDDQPRRSRRDGLMAGGMLLMIICCAAGPAAIGAIAGSLVGGWIGVVAAAMVAVTAVLVLRRGSRGRAC